MLSLVLATALSLQPAIPTDPDAALAKLAEYGEVPPCHPPSRMHPSHRDENGDFHFAWQEQLLIEPLPRLKNESGALLPFAHHPSRRVVQRAVELLCFVGDDASRQALATLQREHPCFDWLRSAARAVDLSFRPSPPDRAACEGLFEPGMDASGPGNPEDWKRWRSDASRALAKRLSADDEAAWQHVWRMFDTLEPRDGRDAMAALTTITSRPAWARLAQVSGPKPELAAPLLNASLESVAAALKTSVAVEVVVATRTSPALAAPAWAVATSRGLGEVRAVEALARKGLKEGRPLELLLLAERAQEWLDESEIDGSQRRTAVVETLFKQRDADGLRAYLADTSHTRRRRLYAALSLAELGLADGLSLLEEPASVQSRSAFDVKEDLERILKLLPDCPARAALTKVLPLYAGARNPYPRFE